MLDFEQVGEGSTSGILANDRRWPTREVKRIHPPESSPAGDSNVTA